MVSEKELICSITEHKFTEKISFPNVANLNLQRISGNGWYRGSLLKAKQFATYLVHAIMTLKEFACG